MAFESDNRELKMKLTRRSSLRLMAGAALTMPYVSRAHAEEEAVLNVYNWVLHRRNNS